ncbi:MAG: hypothetical protein IPJ19_00180 [Planctomycetes bacterium]|nr:hypothetical protein [Planctomycetota bacterium]
MPPQRRPAAAPKAAPKPSAAAATARHAEIQSRTGGASAAAERIKARRGSQQHTDLSPDLQREVELLKQRENKTMTYVWIVCGVLFLAAGGVLGNTLYQRKVLDDKEKQYQQSLDNLLSDLNHYDALKAEDATKILEIGALSSNKELYKGSRIDGQVAGKMSQAQRTIDSATERKDLLERLDQLTRTADGADSQPMDTIKSARRTGQDLADKASIMDDDFKTRVTTAREKVDRAYLTKLLKDAKDKGQTREALTAFTMAEIEIRNALDKTLSGSKDPERKTWYQELYKTLLSDSDAAAVSVFNQGTVDGEPWKDALSSESEWLHSDNLVGFQVKDGQLHVVGPKAGSGRLGSMSVGDRLQLKDFVAQVEFTPIKGNANLYFRVYNRMSSSESYSLNTMGKDPNLKPGQTYTMNISAIGSTLSVKFPNTDVPPFEEQVSATKQRFGSIGFELSEDCEMKITTFKYKELRSNKRP